MRKAPPPLEDAEQMALIEWARAMEAQYPELAFLFHIPNGSKAHVSYRVKLRQLGVNAGIPDLFLPVGRGGYHGLFLEMKRLHGGHLSPAQKTWKQALTDQGYAVHVCKGWVQASEVLVHYLGR